MSTSRYFSVQANSKLGRATADATAQRRQKFAASPLMRHTRHARRPEISLNLVARLNLEVA
jgi:hypothetical protein